MSAPAVREVNSFHTVHVWGCVIWAFALLFFLFGQKSNDGFELRHCSETKAVKYFPFEQCAVASPQKAGTSISGKKTANPVPRGKRLDINRASRAELMTIKGIGEVLAERIVTERTRVGSFTEMKQLLVVKGIGKKKLILIESQAEVKK